MPEGEMGLEGGEVSVGEALALPEASPEELPTGGCGEVIGFVQEQLKAERERAQQAEQAAQALRDRLSEAESALAQAREALDAAERRHQIDLLLIESETVDLESARLLTELALGQMPERDVATAVGELRRRKPFLFRSRRGGAMAGAAMSAAATAGDPAEEAAEEAARTGDRGALLRYLRARRGG